MAIIRGLPSSPCARRSVRQPPAWRTAPSPLRSDAVDSRCGAGDTRRRARPRAGSAPRLSISVGPSSVGTRTFAPSAASQGATGSSAWMSSAPTTSKTGCRSSRLLQRGSQLLDSGLLGARWRRSVFNCVFRHATRPFRCPRVRCPRAPSRMSTDALALRGWSTEQSTICLLQRPRPRCLGIRSPHDASCRLCRP